MKSTLRVLLLVHVSFFSFLSYSQTRIVVIGSSTAAGSGANPYDSSWVGRLQLHYRQNTNPGNADTIVTNLAVGGYTTYHVMPDGYTPPPNRPAPVTTNNVTRALSFNPEVIIINLPTNDIGAGFGPVEFMNNLRFLFQHINSQGVRAFVTTTQPRTQYAAPERQLLRNLVDSINNNFGVYAIDFWTDLATTDGQNNIKPEVNFDNIHVNNLGHRYLFERVRSEALFVDNAPLPVRITSFKGRHLNGAIEISWTSTLEENGTLYSIQRSSDGNTFSDIHSQPGRAISGNGSYSWLDTNPANGTNYYRLKIQEGRRIIYSSIISIANAPMPFAIKRWYKEGPSVLVVEITSENSSNAVVMIYNMYGQTVLRVQATVAAGSAFIRLPVQHLSSGQYIIQVKAGNKEAIQAFIK